MSHVSELISAFLDGELNQGELRRLSEHLAGCGRCKDELDEMREVRAAVRSLPLLEVPPGLVSEAEAEVIPLRRNRGFLVGAAAAVVAVVIAVAALVTPPARTVTVEDLNSKFGARVSLDPSFGPGKVAVPELVEVGR